MATDPPRSPNPRDWNASNDARSMIWSIPAAIAAVVLVAAILIFGGAGPDRTRTADSNNPNSTPSSTTQAQQPESGIPPNSDGAGRKAPAQPQKSTPDGTQ